MEKSAVTEFFLKYFEKNRIDIEEISEKTGIKKEKLSENYRYPLTSEEFLELCFFLGIKPEEIREAIKRESYE
ncbi:MAG: hypothetical protein IKW08_00190 [Roseburia sp.]|nr:hypothetical protein [Roseburia sp.]